MTKRIIAAILGAAVMGMFSDDISASNPRAPRGELYSQRASLFEVLGTNPGDIVFLGNSLTHGCEWHELFNMPNIKNRGINGDTVDGIAERLSSVTAGSPDKIFLLCGVNDVSHDLPAEEIAGNLLSLIERIKDECPNTRLYVESLLPINNSFGRYRLLTDKEQVIRDINAILSEKVPALGATYIDVNPLFCDEDGNLKEELTNDGLHLLGAGYEIWRDALLPYVLE